MGMALEWLVRPPVPLIGDGRTNHPTDSGSSVRGGCLDRRAAAPSPPPRPGAIPGAVKVLRRGPQPPDQRRGCPAQLPADLLGLVQLPEEILRRTSWHLPRQPLGPAVAPLPVLGQPRPPQPGQPPAQFGPTAALNLLTALSDLRNTQNNFMSVWLNYYATRMALMRDLGIMVIDENGRWVDVPIDQAEMAPPESVEIPPAVPIEWLRDDSLRRSVEERERTSQNPTPAAPPPAVRISYETPERGK